MKTKYFTVEQYWNTKTVEVKTFIQSNNVKSLSIEECNNILEEAREVVINTSRCEESSSDEFYISRAIYVPENAIELIKYIALELIKRDDNNKDSIFGYLKSVSKRLNMDVYSLFDLPIDLF